MLLLVMTCLGLMAYRLLRVIRLCVMLIVEHVRRLLKNRPSVPMIDWVCLHFRHALGARFRACIRAGLVDIVRLLVLSRLRTSPLARVHVFLLQRIRWIRLARLTRQRVG